MMKHISQAIVLVIVLICPVWLHAQGIGVGTNTPHSSTILDVQSSNKGISFPSMTTAQRKAIADPKPGLLVYDLDKNTIYMYDGGQWLALLFTVSDALIPPTVRTPADSEVGDEFGYSVAIFGNYAVIGAPSDNVGANTDQGCVYVFVRNQSVWTEQAKIVASDGAAGDRFGYSVAIYNTYLVVGAMMDNSPTIDAGSVYVFLRSGTSWTEQAKLVAGNAAANDHFGCSVAIDGIYAVIGAKDDDVGADVDEGSVYIFSRSGSTWTQQDNIITPFGTAGDHFGYSVAISGDYLVAGANDDDVDGVTDAGSAHVFLRSGSNWGYQDALRDPANIGDEDAHYGEAVAISGNYIVVGAPYRTSYAGAVAFVYLRNGIAWDQQTTLFANANDFSTPVNQFGFSISMEGDYVLIGANTTTMNGVIRKGAAHLFRRDGTEWIKVRGIDDPAGVNEDRMGSAVAVSGMNCVVASFIPNAQRGKVLLLNFE
jgi:hypothetical protein